MESGSFKIMYCFLLESLAREANGGGGGGGEWCEKHGGG